MHNILLIVVGKLKERYLTDACAEYIKRLADFCKLQVIQIDEYKLPDDPSAQQIAVCLEKEGERILAKIPAGAYCFPMCIEGKQMSSPQLAQRIETLAQEGRSQIAFVIGGSYGLSDAVKARGDYRLSMSQMTFPHQLARVMLLEQIYRACSIRANGKYHK